MPEFNQIKFGITDKQRGQIQKQIIKDGGCYVGHRDEQQIHYRFEGCSSSQQQKRKDKRKTDKKEIIVRQARKLSRLFFDNKIIEITSDNPDILRNFLESSSNCNEKFRFSRYVQILKYKDDIISFVLIPSPSLGTEWYLEIEEKNLDIIETLLKGIDFAEDVTKEERSYLQIYTASKDQRRDYQFLGKARIQVDGYKNCFRQEIQQEVKRIKATKGGRRGKATG